MIAASQLSIFDTPAARMHAPSKRPHRVAETSREAHNRIRSCSSELCQRVLKAIEGRGSDGATDEELSRELEIKLCTINPRRGELVREGLVVNSGRRRATLASRSATVWIAVAS